MGGSSVPELINDRYQVGEVIGRGGMATVHVGRDVRLGRQVAIKILRPELAADETFHERFQREAHAVASLNHH
ncbi:serine/threonine protein kinase, partial [Heyndrickxia oleronia]|nr:serine/threonine protein kinase [Heyndrickxia oleronia]